jgi:hypothetical protein
MIAAYRELANPGLSARRFRSGSRRLFRHVMLRAFEPARTKDIV